MLNPKFTFKNVVLFTTPFVIWIATGYYSQTMADGFVFGLFLGLFMFLVAVFFMDNKE